MSTKNMLKTIQSVDQNKFNFAELYLHLNYFDFI